jgi:coenzyme F420-reducing hydrogenase delta subunit
MSEKCLSVVNINQDYCSRCSTCYSICPYEAIKRDSETAKVEIDQQACEVCGICYSACPASAIEMSYYNYDNLVDYVESMRKKIKSDTLVLMCRGNSPSSMEVEKILSEQGVPVDNYIPLRLPCSGRIPTDFIFKALSSGVKNIVSIQCEDPFCRYKEGTKINTRRLLLSKDVLEQLGLDRNALKIIKYSRKAVYDTEKCVGCDKCVFICPYDAIKAEPFATPTVDQEACMGCGACALVCPHHAIEVKGFEFENVLKRYGDTLTQMKLKNKRPALLAFICQWSEFPALDNPDIVFKGKNALALEVPCFKSLDPCHVINALNCGFDGVFAVVCPSKDCKLQEGKQTAERNLDVLQRALKKLNMLDRFEIYEATPKNESEFNDKLDAFYKKIEIMSQPQIVTAEAKEKRTK